jgi:acyl dehydratase
MSTNVRQLYFEGVKVGDELPPLVKPPIDRLQIARYVGAASDWNPLYIDEPHARASGFPSAFAPGTMGMGYLAELATDWTRGARLKRLQSRLVKFIWPGDVLTARGRVVERRFEPGDTYAMDLELWAENQRGELVTRGLATYQLFYSAEDEARQRAGQPPLRVTLAEEEARLARLSRAMPQRPAVVSRPLQPARPLTPPVLPLGAVAVTATARAGAPARPAVSARPPVAKPAPKKPAQKKPAPKKPAQKKAPPKTRSPKASAAKKTARRPAGKPARKAAARKPARTSPAKKRR